MALTKLGFTNVTILFDAESKKLFDQATFLPQIKTSNQTDLVADLFCALDMPSLNRLGIFSETFKRAKRTLVIDHHPDFSLKANAVYSIPEYSSTCELIFNILNKLKLLDSPIATALYIGMRADTVNFRTLMTPNTMRAAAECLKYNIDEQVIYDLELRVSDAQFNVFSSAYAKTKCENGLKIVVLNEEELVKNNIPISNAKSMAIEVYKLIDGIVGPATWPLIQSLDTGRNLP